MNRIPFEPGRIVQSTQGRDKGRSFVVIRVIDEEFVMMADGLTRKLDHQKKKKVKHLHAKPVLMEGLNDPCLKDSDLRKVLKENGLAIDQQLCKED